MKVTILGCGASRGVPIIGCCCLICKSDNPKNKRSRTSIMIEVEDLILWVDAGADFREQALKHNVSHISAMLFTHRHADHTAGVADIAPLISRENPSILPIYSDQSTIEYLLTTSSYLFNSNKVYSSDFTENEVITDFKLNPPYISCAIIPYVIKPYVSFKIKNLEIFPILQAHGDMDSLGFIIGNFAYCTDIKAFYEEAWKVLLSRKLKVLVISCLGFSENFKHVHFDLLMEWIFILNPETVVLTHMGHTVDYEGMKQKIKIYKDEHGLKSDVFPAYDGLVLEV